jgi:hypothetical protein
MHYIQSEAHSQDNLFPVSLDDLVPSDNLVRVIKAYMARLNLREMQPKQTQYSLARRIKNPMPVQASDFDFLRPKAKRKGLN